MAIDRSGQTRPPVRFPVASTRVVVAGTAGLIVFGVVMVFAPWQVAAQAGWDTLAAVYVVWVLRAIWNRDGAETAALATREDDSRAAADVLLVAASLVSLIGVALGLLKAGQEHGSARAAITAVAVVSAFLAWAVVQTVFTLRYAHLYYLGRRGISFHGDDDPDYRDFAYVALTIGMTYQVSDTEVQTKAVRRTVTRHGMLSYVFGTVVVAMMVNVVASLLR